MNSPVKFCPIRALKLDVERDQRKTMVEESKATVLPACNGWLNFRVRDQFEIKLLFHMSLKKEISLSL